MVLAWDACRFPSPPGSARRARLLPSTSSRRRPRSSRSAPPRRGVTNIRTVRAPAGEGALEKNTFDRALLVAVLGEIPADGRLPALREIREALKPDGILYVLEGPVDPHYQTRKAVAHLGGEAGFKLLGTRRLGLTRLYVLNNQ